LRLLPDIRYGTTHYPDRVARRLRAVNIAAWITAVLNAAFAVAEFLDPAPGMWKPAAATAFAVPVYAALPLLHRFGGLAAAIAGLGYGYVHTLVLCLLFGTGAGIHLYGFLTPALAVLFFGTEHILLAAFFGTVATALIVILPILVPHDTGLVPAGTLYFAYFVPSAIAISVLLFAIVTYAVRQIARAEAMAEREHQRSEALLSNILPPRIAERLKEQTGTVIADRHEEASVLFADMAGFTARASDTAPDALVRFLNDVFTRLDRLVERHGLEKIKTTGDAYMVVSGVPEPRPDHAEALAALALDMRDAMAGLVDPKGRQVPVRFGIASGPVVAGVVGTHKFFYDVWGDAVNTASRMESTGEAGKIQVAPETHARLRGGFDLEERGLIDVRGKGQMRTWFLVRQRVC
jgi:adenylate cyclase